MAFYVNHDDSHEMSNIITSEKTNKKKKEQMSSAAVVISSLWVKTSLTLSTLGKIFSRRHFEIFFLIFPRKQDLTFHANCLDNLHEMSYPVF